VPANHNDIEKRLWDAADQLRANSKLKASEYSLPVLGLIFLKYADHVFFKASKEMEGKSTGRRTVGKIDYQDTLKNEKLVLDWRKRQQSRASVRLAIETVLDRLPRTYTKELYQQKCDTIYQHIYDSYFGQDSSIYAHA
jgi:type I restriction-modification system DNA methylase subunit